MKITVTVLAITAAVMLLAAPAEAQVNWGVRGGVYFDETDPFVGVEAIMPISGQWFFNPNVEHVFGDDSFTTINADAHYDFRTGGRGFFWGGAGVAAILGDDSDIGVNVLVGYGSNRGTFIPYLQLKGIIADDNEVVLGGGIRF